MDKSNILQNLLDISLFWRYNGNMDKLYHFNNRFHFTIARCGRSLVGNKQFHPEVKHAWHMDLNHKFLDWDCDRLWVVKKGKGHLVTTFGEFDVTEGHAYYVPASTIIHTHCDDFMEQYFLNFIIQHNNFPLDSLYAFRFESDAFDLAFNLIQGIIAAATSADDGSLVFINSAICTLLSLFIQDVKRDNFSPLTPALKFIEKHLSEKISVQQLAQHCGYTPEYFSALFKSVFHIPPQQYIIEKRITHAQHLLLSSPLSISEIALQCGYDDPLYFSRIFSKQTLCSPTQFRLITKDNI